MRTTHCPIALPVLAPSFLAVTQYGSAKGNAGLPAVGGVIQNLNSEILHSLFGSVGLTSVKSEGFHLHLCKPTRRLRLDLSNLIVEGKMT